MLDPSNANARLERFPRVHEIDTATRTRFASRSGSSPSDSDQSPSPPESFSPISPTLTGSPIDAVAGSGSGSGSALFFSSPVAWSLPGDEAPQSIYGSGHAASSGHETQKPHCHGIVHAHASADMDDQWESSRMQYISRVNLSARATVAAAEAAASQSHLPHPSMVLSPSGPLYSYQHQSQQQQQQQQARYMSSQSQPALEYHAESAYAATALARSDADAHALTSQVQLYPGSNMNTVTHTLSPAYTMPHSTIDRGPGSGAGSGYLSYYPMGGSSGELLPASHSHTHSHTHSLSHSHPHSHHSHSHAHSHTQLQGYTFSQDFEVNMFPDRMSASCSAPTVTF